MVFVPQTEFKDALTEIKPAAIVLTPFHLNRVRKEVLAKVKKNKFAEESLEKLSKNQLKSLSDSGNVEPVASKEDFGLSLRDKLVAEKIRKNFGGNLRGILTSGAAVDHETLQFFWGMKMPIFDGYCSTETIVTSFNTPLKTKLGIFVNEINRIRILWTNCRRNGSKDCI
jgi:long-chain acyl-CoA synthetase